jgi:hypothetical protein
MGGLAIFHVAGRYLRRMWRWNVAGGPKSRVIDPDGQMPTNPAWWI